MSDIPQPTMLRRPKFKQSSLPDEHPLHLDDLRDPARRRIRGKLSLTTFWKKIDGEE